MKYFALFFLCAGCASVPRTDNYNRPFEAWVPADVRPFVIDAQACTHFSGEGPIGDPERDRFLERMIRKTCSGLDQRKAELLKRYAGSAVVRRVIVDAWSDDS